jgi:transposase
MIKNKEKLILVDPSYTSQTCSNRICNYKIFEKLIRLFKHEKRSDISLLFIIMWDLVIYL